MKKSAAPGFARISPSAEDSPRLDEAWEVAARTWPDRCAVVGEAGPETHADVGARAAAIADGLDRLGVVPGHRVAVLAAPGPEALATLRAVLSLGASYVPVALDGAVLRNRRGLDVARPAAVVVAGDRDASSAMAGSVFGVLDVDGRLPGSRRVRPTEAPWRDRSAAVGTSAQEAYVLFTSGSTGVPKAVSLTHANAMAFVQWAGAEFGITPDSRLAACTPWTFDLSVFDIYASQLAGAALCPVGPATALDARRTAVAVRALAVTHWLSVPAVAAALVRAGTVAVGDFPALREWLWCGERMPAGLVGELMDRLAHVRFTNLYGPTETTTASTFHRVPVPPDPAAQVPIGRPLWPGTVAVRHPDGRPAGPGVAGEICITGPGLSAGYLDPGGTPQPLVVSRPDWHADRRCYATGDIGVLDDTGTLHFVGRRDSQLQVGGVRVELGEIEAALGAVTGVAEAAAIVDEGLGDLVAFVALRPPGTLEQVREEVVAWLPDSVRPRRWLVVSALPRGAHGKVDRARLQGLAQRGPQPSG